MSAEPTVRTHSVREVFGRCGRMKAVCRGCGAVWLDDTDAEWLERQPCGTPTTHPSQPHPQTNPE